MRLLVIDNSASLRQTVASALKRDDHRIVTVGTTREADAAMTQDTFDLVVLDLGLPREGGLTWFRRVRAAGLQALVIVLTAHSDVARRLEVFDAGADDFLAKPFEVAELRARVRALGRRRAMPKLNVVRHGDVQVDLTARRICRAGTDVVLTAREWAVLECLWSERGRLVARPELLQKLWGDASQDASNSLDVMVGRIRRKLGFQWVRTVRNKGYSLGI